MKRFIVDQSAQRIDVFLARMLCRSRRDVKGLIVSGGVRVNDRDVAPSYKVLVHDVVDVYEHVERGGDEKKDVLPLSILYEDEHLLVIDKPFNLLVHSCNKQGEKTLIDSLIRYGCLLSDGFSLERPGLVHRLDRFTEGLMVIAKTNSVQEALKEQFLTRRVRKGYYALVYGCVTDDHMVLNYPIAKHPRFGHLRCVSPEGRDAETEVSVIWKCSTKSLLYLRPRTGRMHQLRVHLLAKGFPIIGDPCYGKRRGKGQLLQAHYLSFIHPIFNHRYCFSLPLSSRLVP